MSMSRFDAEVNREYEAWLDANEPTRRSCADCGEPFEDREPTVVRPSGEVVCYPCERRVTPRFQALPMVGY
jgi:formylmethanofuran dehydrogenase subunit E